MKTKTPSLDNQPDLDELLEDYAEARAGYNSSDGKLKYLEKIAQAKEAILAWAESKAPKELDEGDGWDIYFNDGKKDNGKKRSCCPGDDIAYAHNEAIKQFKRNLRGGENDGLR